MTEKAYALQVYIDTLILVGKIADFEIGGLLEEAVVELHHELGMSDYRKVKTVSKGGITGGVITGSELAHWNEPEPPKHG